MHVAGASIPVEPMTLWQKTMELHSALLKSNEELAVSLDHENMSHYHPNPL